MENRTCAYCKGPLNLPRRGAKFCTQKCGTYFRRRANRSPHVPEALTGLKRWVRRSDDKVPLTVDGAAASSTNSRTWTDYEAAKSSSVGAGLGFVLNGDGIGVIDLDHAIIDGVVLPWAAEVLAANPGTFTEVSQSGEGLHVWGLLSAGPGRKIRDGRNIEIYSKGRYVALGTPLRGTTLDLLPLNL